MIRVCQFSLPVTPALALLSFNMGHSGRIIGIQITEITDNIPAPRAVNVIMLMCCETVPILDDPGQVYVSL